MDGHSILAREKVRRLEAFPQLLKKLAYTFDRLHLNLRACVPRLSLGGIPDEVILSILHLACADSVSVVNASRVCRRFRHIALSSSRLWAVCPLTTYMPPHIIDMIISRSGSNGLTIKLYSGDLHEDVFTKLFEYSARWKVVESTLLERTSNLLRTQFPNPDVSRLVKLVHHSDDLPHWRSIFYYDWSLPSLQILSDNALIPPPSFINQAPSLTECHLAPKPSEFPKIISFLNATQSLDEIQINFKYGRGESLVLVDRSLRLSLPTLRKLKLALPSQWSSDITVEDILHMVLCPGILELMLCFENESADTTDGCILEIQRGFPCIRDLCPSLERLSLTMIGSAGKEKLYFIDDILQNLPSTIKHIELSIRHFYIYTHYVDKFPHISESAHPHLTSLKIKLLKQPDQDFFSTVAKILLLQKIKLKELIAVDHGGSKSMGKSAQRAFRRAGVMCGTHE